MSLKLGPEKFNKDGRAIQICVPLKLSLELSKGQNGEMEDHYSSFSASCLVVGCKSATKLAFPAMLHCVLLKCGPKNSFY